MIQKTCSTPSFGAKFVLNKQFKETVAWAEKNHLLRSLDSSLYNIGKAEGGDITVFHGTTPDGRIFSNFKMGKRSLLNLVGDAKSPEEATFYAINELALLGKRYRSLAGTSKVKYNATAESIIKDYSV